MDEQKGQLLIEALVAITVIVIAILGVFTLISRSLSLNRVVSDQYIGTYLAAEGIEIVKNIIDSNVANCDPWNKSVAIDGDFTIEYDSTNLCTLSICSSEIYFDDGIYSHRTGGDETKFTRVINIDTEDMGDYHMRVTSKVEWVTRGGAEFEAELEDHFYNWRPVSEGCT